MPLYPRAEFRVNGYTPGNQDEADVIRLNGSGNYVVTWTTTNGGGTFSQMFGPDGARISGEILNAGSAIDVDTAPLASGGFVFAASGPVFSSSESDIALVRYDAVGGRIGAAIKVDAPPGDDVTPSVTGLQNGGIAVAWDHTDADGSTRSMLELFDASGAKVTGPVELAHSFVAGGGASTARPLDPMVAQLAGGDIVAAWRLYDGGIHGSRDSEIYFQRFTAGGAPIGDHVSLGLDQTAPYGVEGIALTATTDGGFAIAWSEGSGFPDSFSQHVGAQKFDAAGHAVGAAVKFAQQSSGLSGNVDVVATGDGGFRVGYAATGSSAHEVYEQAFNAQGSAVGDPLLVNATTGGDQDRIVLANDANDHGFLAAWTGPDGDGYGVYARLFSDQPAGGGGDGGVVITSPGPGSTLTGGAGNDTLYASQGADVLSGGGGGDAFVWTREPWAPATVTDFLVGTDRIDLSALFAAAGYSGADPVTDKYISLVPVEGGTGILFDHDGPGPSPQYANYIIKLAGISPYSITWNQLASPAAGQTTFNFTTRAVSRDEGNSGTTSFDYVVTRTGSVADAAHVQWSVGGAGGSSAAESDFAGGVFPRGSLDFAPGEASKTLSVSVAGDTTDERDELFLVNLVGVQGGVLGQDRSATGTIVNDDAASPGDGGVIINSPGPGSTLTGGAGNDTLNASQGNDVLRGNGGADAFVYGALPWSAGHVVDFSLGTDRLDISALFRGSGYTGSDPIADGYVTLQAVGDSTKVLYDTDGRGTGNTIQFQITTLDHVPTAGLTWAQLAGSGSTTPPPNDPPSGGPGQVINSSRYGDTLTGGSGNDTLNAGQGPDQLTGAGGADHFVYAKVPWNAGHATDFKPGVDVLDLRGIFAEAGYTGSDPIADRWLSFSSDGAGTRVLVDTDGPGGSSPYQFVITTLDGVQPTQLGPADILFH